MRVILDTGVAFELGTTEAAPTIGITDYSRRVTDDYGVTTVVERGFARRMSVRLGVPFEQADVLQRTLADLRATPATWIADERFGSLSFRGFYKDFSLDLATPPLSLCTLTIEGLVALETFVDAGGDPAPLGAASTLQLLRPVAIGSAQLRSSTVPEADAPEWQSGTRYALGARVIKAATHRIYESGVAGNLGNDPTGPSGLWIDIGPTNRWAMFDQALGTATQQAGSVKVTLDAGAVGAVALLDVAGDTVRVQAPSYDRTAPVGPGALTFLDLTGAAGLVTVTITGSAVAIGTLLVGTIAMLGVTEASPTAAITDFSRKVVDDFGDVTIVERAWAKRMTANALIRTDAVDQVAGRITAVRAQPSLWIGQKGFDSLTVYGFFKEFSIEVGEVVSKLSLSIEGLSTAGKIEPFKPSVDWPDIGDPDGTKPADNADVTGDNTSKDTNAVGGKPATQVLTAIEAAAARVDALEHETIPAINTAADLASKRIAAAATAASSAKARADAAFVEIADRVGEANTRIDSIEAGTVYDDTALKAEVRRVDSAAIGRDASLGQSIQSVSASIETTDSNIRALVETKEQAAVDREDAISRRVDSIIVEGGGSNADMTARAEISRVEEASKTRDGTLALQTSALEASGTYGGNLLSNSTWASAPAGYQQPDPYRVSGWSFAPFGAGAAQIDQWGKNVPGGFFPSPDHALHIHQSGKNQDAYGDWRSDPVSIKPGQRYNATALINCHACDVQLLLIFYDAAGTVVFSPGAVVTQVNGPGGSLSGYRLANILATAPGNAVRGALWVRKFPTSSGASQNDSSAWFTRPMIGEASPTQTGANAYAPGSGSAEQLATSARVDQQAKALSDATTAFAERSSNIEAAAGQLAARVSTTETALSDGRLATAQRVAVTEATVDNVVGRVSNVETAVSDGRFAAASTVRTLESNYKGTAATVTTQAGTIAGLQARTAAYWRTTAVAGNNRAQITISADANAGAGVDIIGDVSISGNLLVSGSVVTDRIALNGVTNTVAIAGMSGGGVSAADTGESGRLTITSTGGTMKVDVQSDGTRTAGSGTMRVQLFAAYSGTETALSREVAFSPSNTAVPIGFFQIIGFPAGTVVQFFLRFFVTTDNTTWNFTSAAIAVTEFKR